MAETNATAKAPRKRASATAETIDVGTSPSSAAEPKTTVGKVKEQAAHLVGEAGQAAKKAAASGKDKAVEALGGVSKLADEAAKSIDQHLGAQYGDYARKASATVTKTVDSLASKDIDDLIEDAKTVVRNNPVAAVGVAAAFGFLLTRLARIGAEDGRA